jgi:hypothetical protein
MFMLICLLLVVGIGVASRSHFYRRNRFLHRWNQFWHRSKLQCVLRGITDIFLMKASFAIVRSLKLTTRLCVVVWPSVARRAGPNLEMNRHRLLLVYEYLVRVSGTMMDETRGRGRGRGRRRSSGRGRGRGGPNPQSTPGALQFPSPTSAPS